jgi:hypothetical protein
MASPDEILKLLREGSTYREIARKLDVSQKTVAKAKRQARNLKSCLLDHGHRRLILYFLIIGTGILAIYLLCRKKKTRSNNALKVSKREEK